MINTVITKENQSALTPAAVIEDLKAGNANFVATGISKRDFAVQASLTTGFQAPKAVILSCIDSRVPVEFVFDQGIGDLFVARVAGNIENVDVLGSLEYACKVAGSKVLMVLGHESCGAVKAACDHVKLGNVTDLLSKIEPAVARTETDGDRASSNPSFVADVIANNVKDTIERIRYKSPILKEMEDNEEIIMVGAVYSLSTRQVNFI